MAPAASADRGSTTAPVDRGGPARLVVAAIITALLLVAMSFVAGRLTAAVDREPATTSVEAGFARDMQVHHQQAVELALIVRDHTDDPDVRLLAYDIATSQSQQAGQMYGWLAEWGLPQAPSEPPMTWMSRPPVGRSDEPHSHVAAPVSVPATMPGYATREQLTELSSATGVDAERLFLQLMIAHHRGGVEMAEAVIERSDNRVVTDLARAIVTAQRGEIVYMEALLLNRSD